MGYEKLDYVLAVAEEQNLTKAAKRLFISQPALTAALNKLDAELGVQLFDRRRPPVKLTAAGAVYVQEMTRIQQLQVSMQTRLRASLQPQLRLGIGTGRGYYWLPILLPTFHARHPEIRVVMTKASFLDYGSSLLDSTYDVGIGALSIAAPENSIIATPAVTEQMLVQEKLVYVIPRSLGIIRDADYRGHSLVDPLCISPACLDGQPFVCAESSSSYPHHMETEMKRWHYHYGDLLIYGGPQAALHLAASGMGCTFTSQPMCHWEQVGERYQVYFCTLSEQMVTQTIQVSYRTDDPQRAAIEDLVRIVEEKVLPQLYPASLAR